MADISRFFFLRHLRGEQSAHVLHFANGRLVREGRGLSFWFLPLSASIAEVPVDDREQAFVFSGRTVDFQEFTVQGVITYRVADPQRVAKRVDFTIDLREGRYLKTPLEKLSLLLTQLAQQFAESATAHLSVREVLDLGFDDVRGAIRQGLDADEGLGEMGLSVVSVRISAIRPTAELDKALQMPTREKIQEASDQATFQRRALAVESERAIAENELKNRIELSRREEELIGQEGANRRREATESLEAKRIEVDGQAELSRVQAQAEADGIALLEEAKVHAEKARMEIYESLPTHVMMGLAAREFAGKLERIDHLNLSPELFGPMLTDLIEAGTRRLEAGEAK